MVSGGAPNSPSCTALPAAAVTNGAAEDEPPTMQSRPIQERLRGCGDVDDATPTRSTARGQGQVHLGVEPCRRPAFPDRHRRDNWREAGVAALVHFRRRRPILSSCCDSGARPRCRMRAGRCAGAGRAAHPRRHPEPEGRLRRRRAGRLPNAGRPRRGGDLHQRRGDGGRSGGGEGRRWDLVQPGPYRRGERRLVRRLWPTARTGSPPQTSPPTPSGARPIRRMRPQDTVGTNEALIAAFGAASTAPGHVVWNSLTGQERANKTLVMPTATYGINPHPQSCGGLLHDRVRLARGALGLEGPARPANACHRLSIAYADIRNISLAAGRPGRLRRGRPALGGGPRHRTAASRPSRSPSPTPPSACAYNGPRRPGISPSGGTAQGDTITFINPLFVGSFADYCTQARRPERAQHR